MVLVGNHVAGKRRVDRWLESGEPSELKLDFYRNRYDEQGDFWERDGQILANYYNLFREIERVHPEQSDSVYPGMELHVENWDHVYEGYPNIRSLKRMLRYSRGFSRKELWLHLASPYDQVDEFVWSFYVDFCQSLSDHIQFVKPEMLVSKFSGTLDEKEERQWLQYGYWPSEWREEPVPYPLGDLGLGFLQTEHWYPSDSESEDE
jgi:hypothetical protein